MSFPDLAALASPFHARPLATNAVRRYSKDNSAVLMRRCERIVADYERPNPDEVLKVTAHKGRKREKGHVYILTDADPYSAPVYLASPTRGYRDHR